MQGHGGSTLNITELVSAGGGVAVSVEEFGNGSSVFREVGVLSALVPFLIVINNVVSLGSEEFANLLVLEDCVKNPDLVDGGLSTSISDSSCSNESEESKMDFPNEGLVKHQETERAVTNESSGPSIVGSVKSLIDLINVIGSSHSPFPVIVLENVVAIREFAGVSFGFRLCLIKQMHLFTCS